MGGVVMTELHGTRSALRLAIVALSAVAAGAVYSQTLAPTNNLPNPYHGSPFGTMPEGRSWGSTAGVAIDPDGTSVWVAERCGGNSCADSALPPLLKFDTSGKLAKS